MFRSLKYILLAATLSFAAVAQAQETTRPHAGMLRYPSLSQDRIAFVYAGKLWQVPRAGGLAIPTATPPGSVAYSQFSPDGKTIAFTGNYDGNGDIYTIPTEGGNPFRVTYHPGGDVLCGWVGNDRLLYYNGQMSGNGRVAKLLTTSTKGGMPTTLPVPYGQDAAISPDGRWLAYTPSSTNTRTWKRYVGGWAQDIWLFDLQTKAAKKITDWEGTDTFPMWAGETLYYLSDNGPEGRLNIWKYDTKSGKRQQVTKFADYDVKWPSIGPGAIIFQHGPNLRLLDLATGQTKTVEVRVPGDNLQVRPRTVNAAQLINSWDISPTAKRVTVSARGDIWTIPAKDGAPRNLTRTSGANERNANWSPDGRWIAYLSDATGEYEVYITQSDGKGETKQLTKNGTCFRYIFSWSPDNKYLLIGDKTGAMEVMTVATGQVKKLDMDPVVQSSGPSWSPNWSPDSRYITYHKQDEIRTQSYIVICDVESGEKKQVTSGMFTDSNPVFDRKGEFLYYNSSRSFNRPIYDALQGTWIYQDIDTIVAVPLRKDVASPLLPKSDEEKFDSDSKKTDVSINGFTLERTQATQADPISGDWEGKVTGIPSGDVTIKMTLKLTGNNITGSIDATGLGTATVAGTFAAPDGVTLTVTPPGNPALTFTGKVAADNLNVSASSDGNTFTITARRTKAATGTPPAPATPTPATPPASPSTAPVKVTIDYDNFEARGMALPLRPGRLGGLNVNAQGQLLFVRVSLEGMPEIKLFDMNDPKREEKTVAAGTGSYAMTPDGKKLLVLRGAGATIQDAVAGPPGEAVPMDGLTVTIEPRAEWKQIFNEAWRTERDFFYDPNMHGVDWKAIHDQYAKMLEDANSRADVGYIISEMISELNVGHAYYGGGDTPPEPSVSVGMLGADFSLENGAYRIVRIIKGGPWDTDARGPLSEPGVKVKEGDYILAVNGVPIDATKDPWAAFQGMAGRVVSLTVSEKPTLDSVARDVSVRLLGSEGNLRYRDWIETNRAYVEKKTGGKVGYIYVPDTGQGGQSDLVRQLMGQLNKEALIIDERWNGGGQIPDRFIELLNRPVLNYWARRDGKDWVWPPAGHSGPKCMLVNGLSGSGGDAFPWYFKQAKLGKVIGTRTWGGLVGLSGNPSLVDGASVTAPTFAFYETDGTWAVEGHGVDPDIEILDDPSKMQNGADPQLDTAITLMLDEIKKNPYVPPKRPAYPNRKGIGVAKPDF